MDFISSQLETSSLVMIKTSSTNNKRMILRNIKVLNPDILPYACAYLSIQLRPSITNIKIKGD